MCLPTAMDVIVALSISYLQFVRTKESNVELKSKNQGLRIVASVLIFFSLSRSFFGLENNNYLVLVFGDIDKILYVDRTNEISELKFEGLNLISFIPTRQEMSLKGD